VSKSNSRKLKPTNIAIPNNATVVQKKKLLGFVLGIIGDNTHPEELN
jgi:hypothetical protein